MADYFTSDHFKLLNKWRGQKRDSSNPEQNAAYDELAAAYEITEAWANALQEKIFPHGYVSIRKRPTNQGNNFAHYNWARIYPTEHAPKALAFTVGIDANSGFVVKIDTVGMDDGDPVRKAYLQFRGPYEDSPVVAILSTAEGLKKSLPELVEWSAQAVAAFEVRYDELAKNLGVVKILSNENILGKFVSKPEFASASALWSMEVTSAFCDLARAVHEAGLDWWHTGIAGPQIRFGRKQPGQLRASAVLGYVHCGKVALLQINDAIEGVSSMAWREIGRDLVANVLKQITASHAAINDWKEFGTERAGYWPDELRAEQADPSDMSAVVLPMSSETPVPAGRACFNRIYYGPPGTGKTYRLSKLLSEQYQQPVSSESQEEWRSRFISENVSDLTWWEGVAAALYELGGSAKVGQLFDHPFIQAIAATKARTRNVRQTLWAALQTHADRDSKTVGTDTRIAPAVFDKTTDSVWHFTGDWKEACADQIAMVEAYRAGPEAADLISRYSFVTFHQSYGYEEFVEGLRPVLEDESKTGNVTYTIRPGAFKALCQRARAAPKHRFAMVIDEINRGNISKIFGELITLIESDKREGAEHSLSVVLPYSGELFSVPGNVDIIGTMNTADRSLALLDTALRRRFDFEAVMPDTRDEKGAPLHRLRVGVGEQAIDVPRMLGAINQRIEALYDRDHCIGHAYFTPLARIADMDERFSALQQVFSHRILPLLEEYFFDDWQKIGLVLADNQKPVAARFVVEGRQREDDLDHLFGSDHGLDSYATRHRYLLQSSALSNPEAYLGIYRTLPG